LEEKDINHSNYFGKMFESLPLHELQHSDVCKKGIRLRKSYCVTRKMVPREKSKEHAQKYMKHVSHFLYSKVSAANA